MQRISTEVNGRPMAAWRAPGRRPPVVCVHGAGVSSRELLPFVEELGRRNEAWAVDLPGFGASPGPAYPLGLRALADAVADWTAAADLDGVVLLGSSFGCQVAVDAAVRHPDRVAGLVLVGPTVDAAARGFGRQLLRWLRNSPRERVSMAALNIADYRDAGTRRVVDAFREALRDRVEDRLPHVRVPALVVRGAGDRLVPQDWAEEVTRLLPAGRLAVVPDAGHMVPYRRPRELAALVGDFLSGGLAAADARGGGRPGRRAAG
ncbi:alpha/beta fold hydrolase [Marinitenerispora sediminis]|uniref:Alpha/beta hydrolase n=1 Tax=Marinitenerispora sediminis TaxID=1931232 RepID=A0A368T6F5_9ACTN|nr:alpha/beta hydrolase [Marinitenerispora sediminis]RCV51728.1 alpha/beta hydrolase [Marinitenerispora sediminis]RCV55111.1 alpha/beta hydrolase [Marinitenerispora sediminis]RCV59074.1 alpha/beta hydrolase [Marinitenerispora sediminis]